jgi:sortase A
MSSIHRVARLASAVFLAAGLLALGYAGYVVIDARMYQRSEARRFEHARQDAAAKAALTLAPAAPVPVARIPDDGELMGEIVIPRLGLMVMVAQGDSAQILERAVGHLPGTALPGAIGNVALAGHRDTFFRPLKDVRVGDAITLKTPDGDFEYLVESTSIVRPTDVQVLAPTGGRTLTLITCFPFYYIGAAPNRFIVRARAS